MTLSLALLLWSPALLLGGSTFSISRRSRLSLISVCVLMSLLVLSFWRFFAEIELTAGYASLWVLIALLCWRKKLDRHNLSILLLNGLIALNAVLLSIASASLLDLVIGKILVWPTVAILFFGGAVLCLIGDDTWFPWDYAAWFAGWLVLLQVRSEVFGEIGAELALAFAFLLLACIHRWFFSWSPRLHSRNSP